jgi:quercetin dioxygenase-like cupin family protein
MTNAITGKVRRVVTGLDANRRSVIVLDDTAPAKSAGAGEAVRTLFDAWATVSTSADPSKDSGPGLGPNATELRIVELPPGHVREMHRTDTIDYGLVLSGELYAIMESGETLLRAGDVIVQRGTNHAWQNRSNAPTRIAFINMSGQKTDPKRCPDV